MKLFLVSTVCGFMLSFIPSVLGKAATDNSGLTIVPIDKVSWISLNPARGDKSPQAGTLWGDLRGGEATGFLAKFVDGFSSPPHIHNVTYRAVVISGQIHNDDPSAEKMWMQPGSFWTQPKGEAHITAARGENNIALVEIDHGPYLVKHTHEAFDSGERPVNVDASNIVWVTPYGMDRSDKGPKIAYLWGDPEGLGLSGSFVKLPKGFVGDIHSTGSEFRVVTIDGTPTYLGEESVALPAGSYFSSTGEYRHKIGSAAEEDTVLYIRANGHFQIIESDKP